MDGTAIAAIVAAITLLLIFIFAIYLLRSTVNIVQQGYGRRRQAARRVPVASTSPGS